jgi:hypothetical protein
MPSETACQPAETHVVDERPAYELDGLVTMSVTGRQVLLPLWHEISKDEVVFASPSLADKVALRTADYTIHEIAAEIAGVVRECED